MSGAHHPRNVRLALAVDSRRGAVCLYTQRAISTRDKWIVSREASGGRAMVAEPLGLEISAVVSNGIVIGIEPSIIIEISVELVVERQAVFWYICGKE